MKLLKASMASVTDRRWNLNSPNRNENVSRNSYRKAIIAGLFTPPLIFSLADSVFSYNTSKHYNCDYKVVQNISEDAWMSTYGQSLGKIIANMTRPSRMMIVYGMKKYDKCGNNLVSHLD